MRVALLLSSEQFNLKNDSSSSHSAFRDLKSPHGVDLSHLLRTRDVLSKYLKETPLIQNPALNAHFGTNLYFKDETTQPTRNFKVRGALAKISSLTAEQRRHGVAAASQGNHGQGVAYAASLLAVNNPPPLIFAPKTISPHYAEAMRKLGAEIRLRENFDEALAAAFQSTQEEGRIFVHPYDDPEIVAGQGTLGLELLSQLPRLTDVVFSVGGGGMLVGLGVAIKSLKPEVRLWAVETRGADSLAHSLTAGRIVHLGRITSKAKTLGIPLIPERNFKFAQDYLEGKKVTVVSDEEALESQKLLYRHTGIISELAASCTLAAVRKLPVGPRHQVAIIVCGGNPPEDEVQSLNND